MVQSIQPLDKSTGVSQNLRALNKKKQENGKQTLSLKISAHPSFSKPQIFPIYYGYTVKKRLAIFPPGRVWLVPSRLGTGKSLTFFSV
jgi:hypothetical protein